MAWKLMTEVAKDVQLHEQHQDLVFPMAEVLWQYYCGSTITNIWRLRNLLMNEDAPSRAAFLAGCQARLRSGLNNIRFMLSTNSSRQSGNTAATVLRLLITVLLGQVTSPRIERLIPRQGEYLLFFDGGSRGNPGPGGSGSVLLKVHIHLRQAHIIWAASMAYGNPRTTNNVTEYMELIHGLCYAKQHSCEPLHIMGDSAMIIRQQLRHHSPNNKRLAALYFQSKRLADTMAISSWTHHYRAYNKMADLAANHAMDSSTSTQYAFLTSRRTGTELNERMEGDVQHWFDHRLREDGNDPVSRNDLAVSMGHLMRQYL